MSALSGSLEIWPGMKALSLTQPWASLIALGAKKIETRSWSTSYRGTIAIHASKGLPKGLPKGCELRLGRYDTERDESGLLMRGADLRWPYRLPLGSIVATATLVDVVRTNAIEVAARFQVAPDEEEYGDYGPRRFAWLLNDVKPIHPVPMKGALGLWEVADVA
jgi:activating signal cointegrator 1